MLTTLNTTNEYLPVNKVPFSDEEFELFSRLIYDVSGIHITVKKKMLVKNRLINLIHSRNFNSFSEYFDHVCSNSQMDELKQVINKICTNYTYFFRESAHFEFLQRYALSALTEQRLKENKREIRIWSAGCSTGEEPYTIAMMLHNFFGETLAQWDIKILATDISETALEKARSGFYSRYKLDGVPANYRFFCFDILDKETVQVKESIHKMVSFRRLNLVRDSFPFQYDFDFIFCRNVMIYFDRETTESLVNRFYNHCNSGGYLLIGHSESLMFGNSNYKYVKPSIYKKEESDNGNC